MIESCSWLNCKHRNPLLTWTFEVNLIKPQLLHKLLRIRTAKHVILKHKLISTHTHARQLHLQKSDNQQRTYKNSSLTPPTNQKPNRTKITAQKRYCPWKNEHLTCKELVSRSPKEGSRGGRLVLLVSNLPTYVKVIRTSVRRYS